MWLASAFASPLASALASLGLAVVLVECAVRVLARLAPRPRLQTEAESQVFGTKARFDSSLQRPATRFLSVIIPAFNEELRISVMLAETLNHLLTQSYTWEIILVDDGSCDDTINVACKFAKSNNLSLDQDLRILKAEANRGKGGAVALGMQCARGEYLLFVDADGATRFSDLDTLVKRLQGAQDKDGYGVAVGSRAHMVKTEAVVKVCVVSKTLTVQRSAIRNFLMHSLHAILYVLGIQEIKDTQCGFKLVSRKAAALIFPAMHVQGWIFDIEMLLLAQNAKIPLVEVPVNWHEVGGSKVSIAIDSIRMLRDLIVLRACYLLGIWVYPERPDEKKMN
ncbi:MAG: hypothetical protein SGCHY_002542 [Lobulomycetales sp.]